MPSLPDETLGHDMKRQEICLLMHDTVTMLLT